MRSILAAAALPFLAWPAAARPDDAPTSARVQADCTIDAGPNDRVAQDHDLVIPAGAVVESAVVLRGQLLIERGARVRKAVAAGGSITVKAGAVVEDDAVAVGGDVRIEAGGAVHGDVVAIGGQVRQAEGGTVKGSVTALSFQLGGTSLARSILDGIKAKGACKVVERGG